MRQSLCTAASGETGVGLALTSAVSEAGRVYLHQSSFRTACRFIQTTASEDRRNDIYGQLAPHHRCLPCLLTHAGPQPAGGLWPCGDHSHQCCWLPHPVSGLSLTGGRASVGMEPETPARQELPSPEQDVEVKRKRQVCRSQPGTQETSLVHLSIPFLCTVLH